MALLFDRFMATVGVFDLVLVVKAAASRRTPKGQLRSRSRAIMVRWISEVPS
jgi:hypothetical protein